MADDAIEDQISEIYRADPGDFVAARKRLADGVKAEDPERAKQIGTLRKPTVAAWALNAVAHEDPERVAELRDAGAALRRAQAEAMGGAGDKTGLREAETRRRSVLRALSDAAVERAGEAQRENIESTLEAASVDDALGDELTAGRLTKPHSRPSGIDDLASMLSASPERNRSRADRTKIKQFERRIAKAESVLDRHRDDLAREEERLGKVQEAVDSARQRVEAATAELEGLRAELDAAAR